jgi:hypothetical protein
VDLRGIPPPYVGSYAQEMNSEPSSRDEETGLPGLYVWVLVLFAVDILLLVALERMYS